MPQPIARMYDSPTTASAVSEELQKSRLNSGDIHVITGPAEGAAADEAATAARITRFGYTSAAAKAFAEHLARGEAMVVVTPPFGYAQTAMTVMDRHSPVAVALPAAPMASAPAAPRTNSTTTQHGTAAPAPGADDPAPLSRALGWPLLIDDPAPLSRKFGWRVLKEEPETSATLDGIRKQSDDPAPLSRRLGLSVLKSSEGPSATLDNIRRQSDDAAPLSRRFGWKLLTDEPAPLSKRFGWKLLLDDPAPLSRKFGWPTLSK